MLIRPEQAVIDQQRDVGLEVDKFELVNQAVAVKSVNSVLEIIRK